MTAPPAARVARARRLTLGTISRACDLGRLARRHETVLQIDDDQRGTRRIDIVEGMQPAAASQRPLDRPGWISTLCMARTSRECTRSSAGSAPIYILFRLAVKSTRTSGPQFACQRGEKVHRIEAVVTNRRLMAFSIFCLLAL